MKNENAKNGQVKRKRMNTLFEEFDKMSETRRRYMLINRRHHTKKKKARRDKERELLFD